MSVVDADAPDAFVKEVADAVPHIIWTHDADGQARYFNRRWTDYTGVTVDETIRVGPDAFVHPDDHERVMAQFVQARGDGQPFTTIYRLRGRSSTYRLHEARVVPVRGQGKNVTLWVGTATDVEERERIAEEQRYLAQASTILGTSLEVKATLRDVARMLVPKLADWCAIDLLKEGGSLERAAVEHVDPEKVQFAWRLWEALPPQPESPTGAFAVIRTRRPELLEVTDEILVAAITDRELLEAVRRLGLRSSICVPLLARERVLGALTLVTAESANLYQPRDVDFAQEVARRISIALDNAQLYEEATQARNAAQQIAAAVVEQSKAVEQQLLTMRAERDAARADLAKRGTTEDHGR